MFLGMEHEDVASAAASASVVAAVEPVEETSC